MIILTKRLIQVMTSTSFFDLCMFDKWIEGEESLAEQMAKGIIFSSKYEDQPSEDETFGQFSEIITFDGEVNSL